MSNKHPLTASELAQRSHEELEKALAHFKAAVENYARAIQAQGFVRELRAFAQELREPPEKAKLAKPTAKSAKPKADTVAKPAKQGKLTPGLHPVFKKSAQKAFQNLADSRKKAAEPAKQPAGPAPVPHTRLPRSVRVTPHEVTLNIGGHPVKELAEQDAKDFLNSPKVFWYRSTQFPDPRRFGVQPHVEAVKVVKRADPKFTRAPWTTSVTISVVGDDKKCDSWGMGVYTRNKAEQE